VGKGQGEIVRDGMKYSCVEMCRSESIAKIRIYPKQDGTIDDDIVSLIERSATRAENDDEIRVVVLCGGMPGVFIRHFDLTLLSHRSEKMREKGYSFDVNQPVAEGPIHRLIRYLPTMTKPVIAALNGTAMGGGFELALACDFRIAQAGEYLYGLPEINVGLIPGAGGTRGVARLVGRARGLELLMRGRTVGPSEAVELGLVNEVAADALERALVIAEELKRKEARALRHIKWLLWSPEFWPSAMDSAAARTLFADLMVDARCSETLRVSVAQNRRIEES